MLSFCSKVFREIKFQIKVDKLEILHPSMEIFTLISCKYEPKTTSKLFCKLSLPHMQTYLYDNLKTDAHAFESHHNHVHFSTSFTSRTEHNQLTQSPFSSIANTCTPPKIPPGRNLQFGNGTKNGSAAAATAAPGPAATGPVNSTYQVDMTLIIECVPGYFFKKGVAEIEIKCLANGKWWPMLEQMQCIGWCV